MTNNHRLYAHIMLACSIVVSSAGCSAKKETMKIPPKQGLILEYDTEGFVDNNTFRVIVIIPAEHHTDESRIRQKGQERALVSLKNYVISTNKKYDAKIHTYIVSTVMSFGVLTQRDSMCSTRYCYFFDINKNGLKNEIDSLAR